MQAVDEFIAQAEAAEDVEDPVPNPNAPAGAPKPVPKRSTTGAIVMPSPSLRANASLSANSYHEAFASSLRNRGYSVE